MTPGEIIQITLGVLTLAAVVYRVGYTGRIIDDLKDSVESLERSVSKVSERVARIEGGRRKAG